jgi:hypothetical protein
MLLADFDFQINVFGPHMVKDTTCRTVAPVEGRLAVTLRFFFWRGGRLLAIPTPAHDTFSKFRNSEVSRLFQKPTTFANFSPSVVLSVFIAVLGVWWIPEHRLQFMLTWLSLIH